MANTYAKSASPADVIRAARERRGLPRSALALFLRVSKTTIRGWERTDAVPCDLKMVKHLAISLRMTDEERDIVGAAVVARAIRNGGVHVEVSCRGVGDVNVAIWWDEPPGGVDFVTGDGRSLPLEVPEEP